MRIYVTMSERQLNRIINTKDKYHNLSMEWSSLFRTNTRLVYGIKNLAEVNPLVANKILSKWDRKPNPLVVEFEVEETDVLLETDYKTFDKTNTRLNLIKDISEEMYYIKISDLTKSKALPRVLICQELTADKIVSYSTFTNTFPFVGTVKVS